MARSLRTQFGLAVRVALVAGFIFGLYDAIVAVDRNAFAFSAQYVWLYAIVPIQFWVLLALLFLLPLALVVALFASTAGGRGLWRYAAVAGVIGGISIALPQAGEAAARLA